MAYTWHTVASATRELLVVERALARERGCLAALLSREEGQRNRWAEGVHRRTIGNLERRRDILAGELEKARENEARGIPPMGAATPGRKETT